MKKEYIKRDYIEKNYMKKTHKGRIIKKKDNNIYRKII